MPAAKHELNFLDGGGETGALMRAYDWSASPLGPPESWPQSLRSVVGLILANRHLMFIAWGPELAFLYNDGYRPVFGAKHPWALGRPFREVWPEIWDDIAPLVETALGGEATWSEDLHLVMERNGYPEDCWFTFSYSPVRDESGTVAGLFCAGTETTGRVLAERRQAFRLQLDERLRDLANPRAVMDAAVELLGRQLGADRVGYGEVQPDDLTVLVQSCFANRVAPLAGVFPLDGFGPGMIARQREGLTQSSADVAADSDQDTSAWSAIETRAFASVPLVRSGRFVASLYVNFRAPHLWTDHEIALLEDTAARTWSAVERARAEDALRRSEERYRQIVEGADDFAIVTLDAHGIITGWNTGAERMMAFRIRKRSAGTATSSSRRRTGRRARPTTKWRAHRATAARSTSAGTSARTAAASGARAS